jgi:hypothetical protein
MIPYFQIFCGDHSELKDPCQYIKRQARGIMMVASDMKVLSGRKATLKAMRSNYRWSLFVLTRRISLM